MLRPFFVTGLPRSRTAWLAALLTTDRSLCLHDPEKGTILNTLATSIHEPWRVGAGGPELVGEYGAISKLYPAAPWVVIVRPQEAALAAFRATMARNGDLGKCSEKELREFWKDRVHNLALITRHAHVLVFGMNDLDDEKTVRLIWKHLLPEIEFQAHRWNVLKAMNVQQQLPSYALTA